MKWLYLPAAALSLAIATPALAAPRTGPDHTAAQPAQQLVQNQDQRKTPRRDAQTRPNNQVPPRQQTQQQRQQRDRNVQRNQQRQRYDWRQYHQGQLPPDWRRHNNFNQRLWQRNLRAERRFHWNRYNRPPGWYYRQWVYGAIFPQAFWVRDYWIDSYWDFGLMAPPYGYVWVRYGDDAVLVNVHSGVILRVVYGVFY